jgi:hypothetical protein
VTIHLETTHKFQIRRRIATLEPLRNLTYCHVVFRCRLEYCSCTKWINALVTRFGFTLRCTVCQQVVKFLECDFLEVTIVVYNTSIFSPNALDCTRKPTMFAKVLGLRNDLPTYCLLLGRQGGTDVVTDRMEPLGRARAGASPPGLSVFFSQERGGSESVYSRRSALKGPYGELQLCRHLCYHIAITDNRCPRIIQGHIARPTACLAICPKLPLEYNSGCRARL